MSALLHRRKFVATALTLLGGAIVTVGCGGGSSSPTSPGNPGGSNPTPTPASPGSITGVVADNHPDPHIAVITEAQLSAGAALTLDIANSRHSHIVTLSSAQVTQIAAHSQVSVTSSVSTHSDGTEPHSHRVTFN